MTETATHVVIGLSGGVDSAVAAHLLKQQNFDTLAVFMKNWNEDDTDAFCPAAEDLADANSVAAQLNIPLKAVNFSDQYWDKVFLNFLNEYNAGRTPNPDILCNKEIKFSVFLDYALSIYPQSDTTQIATGHYARVKETNGQYYLLKAQDQNKDQSYFLHTLNQYQLSKVLFPLGEIDKKQVRHIAEQLDLAVYDKKDSTGICFIGERDFNLFLSRFLKSTPGNIVTNEDKVIGQHHGLIYYTLGQRKGLGIGGTNGSSGEPWYVAEKDLTHNRLIVVQGKQHPLLYSNSLITDQVHWISGQRPELPLRCQAKTRYRQTDQACEIVNSTQANQYQVIFQQPQFAITPGQSVVFYEGNICLGGGLIKSSTTRALGNEHKISI